MDQHDAAGAAVSLYGPALPGADEAGPPRVVQAFADLDLEYAALRKGAGLLDLPQRATLEIAGADRAVLA